MRRWLVGALVCLLSAAGTSAQSGDNTYDYVIVGGGLAGSVLANRLSSSGHHSVMLLSVGDAPPKAYSGPVMIAGEFKAEHASTADDGLRADIRQPGYPAVLDFHTDSTGSSTARMLGGSSLVALSLYLRDHPEALDSWGSEQWSWEILRPYFHRAEALNGRGNLPTGTDYGRDGPFSVMLQPAFVHDLSHDFVTTAAKALGMPQTADLNADRGPTAVGITPTTQNPDGSKVQAYDAYLAPAMGRSNLHVVHGVRADRLVIQDQACHGVAYRRLHDATDQVAYARKEVVLSSGYIYSPRLLFLSGIGPKDELQSVGLNVIQDLPAVGRNLTAARFTPVTWPTKRPTLSQELGAPISQDPQKARPHAYGSAIVEATARARSRVATKADPQAKRPDIVLSFMPLHYVAETAPKPYSLHDEPWPLNTNAYTILATIGETKAQGRVIFPSGSPDVSPVVEHDPMTELEDMQRALEALQLAREIGDSMADSGAAKDAGPIKTGAWSAVYDGRGTCRMGKSPSDSVVDEHLRVHGISGLRVVDGSVIPKGSPFLALPEVLAVAERAADLILSELPATLETAAKPAAAVGVGLPQTVSINSLVDVLGAEFPLTEAVSYLATGRAKKRYDGEKKPDIEKLVRDAHDDHTRSGVSRGNDTLNRLGAAIMTVSIIITFLASPRKPSPEDEALMRARALARSRASIVSDSDESDQDAERVDAGVGVAEAGITEQSSQYILLED